MTTQTAKSKAEKTRNDKACAQGHGGDSSKGITNNVKAFGNDLNFMVGGSKHAFKYEKIKSHASGGLITATHHALVGSAGPPAICTF